MCIHPNVNANWIMTGPVGPSGNILVGFTCQICHKYFPFDPARQQVTSIDDREEQLIKLIAGLMTQIEELRRIKSS